ncbi:Transcriptional regulator, LysR family [Azotobacter vinelandii CA]|uniref:Transcriptional regulator, LysR family n=6 Tax=Azotobacter vinelandii TaxID=354 RepID=C1DMN3_AZOVD|nr:LysR family transcriptional regulator [Azotobacter vinelandii]ACO77063.1 Transcriptional regulator, LysR family [Azotobacter vinelandii DJ]AGK17178.1 Transcriptional regulator, LysR family [Azotobacter vinelandii CA]AGK19538.1 Transcriptional regulator, LysR family [Azotobacter vinelandii CA6]WKN22794.1 LysR family transcriptional regulator [Azotobacter vinelandii]
MHIDLRQLRHFVALAEHRSFVAAAAAVNLSQSAFSRSIQSLEHSAGFQLVDRGSKDLPPTQQGLVLLEHARRLLRQAQELDNEIGRLNGAESGALRFGCGPAPAAQLVPQAVAGFIADYPRAQVNFQVDNWQELNARLIAGEIEFFVADTRRFEADPDYRVVRLQPQRWTFCCREDHPLAQTGAPTCRELFAFPLATTFRPPNIRKVLVDYSGRRDFQPAVECEHSYALLNVVLHSDAIGIGSALNLEPYILRGNLRLLTPRDLPEHLEELHTRYGIVSRNGRTLSPLAQAMIARIEHTDRALTERLSGLPSTGFDA